MKLSVVLTDEELPKQWPPENDFGKSWFQEKVRLGLNLANVRDCISIFLVFCRKISQCFSVARGVLQSSPYWCHDVFQLPYYKDDKVNVTQSVAIMRYLARKYDLGKLQMNFKYFEWLVSSDSVHTASNINDGSTTLTSFHFEAIKNWLWLPILLG